MTGSLILAMVPRCSSPSQTWYSCLLQLNSYLNFLPAGYGGSRHHTSGASAVLAREALETLTAALAKDGGAGRSAGATEHLDYLRVSCWENATQRHVFTPIRSTLSIEWREALEALTAALAKNGGADQCAGATMCRRHSAPGLSAGELLGIINFLGSANFEALSAALAKIGGAGRTAGAVEHLDCLLVS